jgi:type II secretory pathway pseudopilin PulG
MTLVELLIAMVMMGFILYAAVLMISRAMKMWQRSSVQSQMSLDARTMIDTISKLLQGGRSGTVVISTSPSTPPNSKIKFTQTNGQDVNIYWGAGLGPGDAGIIQITIGTQPPKTIGSNVSGLMFTGDYSDPSVVHVSLRMDKTYGAVSDNQTVYVLNQTVRLMG